MTRRANSTIPPEAPVIICALEGRACIKIDGDGGGEIRLTFPETENDMVNELSKNYRKQELIITVHKRSPIHQEAHDILSGSQAE